MKKILMSTLTAGLAFAMITNTGTAHAENFDEREELPKSKATVTFTAPEESVKPVDPREPSSEVDYTLDKDGGTETGDKGPLSLDVVPQLDFGNASITSKKTIMYAANTEPYIQVSDFRGPEGGWHVRAQLSKFNLKDTSKETLHGATITLSKGEAASSVNPAPSAPDVLNNTDGEITLVSGEDFKNIVSADRRTEEKQAEGLGTWIVRWLAEEESNENVRLTVPAFEASAGTHNAFINWTLTDGPVITTGEVDNEG